MGSTARATAAVLAAMCLLPLSGCLPATPNVIPTTAATSTPVFADEEEALAAAIEAYEAYLAVSDEIAQQGGEDARRFSEVVTAEWLEREVASAATLEESGRRQHGASLVQNGVLQRLDQTGEVVFVGVYICLDLSKVTFVDREGGNPSKPPAEMVVEVAFESAGSDRDHLLVGGSAVWPSNDICSPS